MMPLLAALVGSDALAGACPFSPNRWNEARLLPQEQSVPAIARAESIPALERRADEISTIWNDELRRTMTDFRDLPPGGPDRQLARPIGRLDILGTLRNGETCLTACTAWLIDGNHLLTNAHCTDPEQFSRIKRLGVRLGYVSDAEPGEFFEVDTQPEEWKKDSAVDYAIFRVQGNPTAKYGSVTLQPTPPGPAQPLVVVGYPAGFREQIVRGDCYAAATGPIVGGKLLHQCHTVGGNSGSPVFDARTGAVVALHFLGGFDGHGGYNQAIPITAISAVSPIIGALFRGSSSSRVAPAPGPPPVTVLSGTYPQPGTVFRDRQTNGSACGDCPEMVVIPAGSFTMGSAEAEATREEVPAAIAARERPQHRVTVPSFALAKNAVTRGEFAAFVRDTGYDPKGCFVYKDNKWGLDQENSWRNPAFEQTDRHPVVCVSWKDVQRYVGWLNSKVSGGAYRLPSEAEWEYAARAGTITARFWGDGRDAACTYANVSDLTAEEVNNFSKDQDWTFQCRDGYGNTAPVGSFRSNPFGLHDMLGNVWQWTEDTSHNDYQGAPTDGSAWTTGDSNSARVVRGGSWSVHPWNVRSANRSNISPDLRLDRFGFRLARTLNLAP